MHRSIPARPSTRAFALTLLLAVLASAASALLADGPFALRDGDRVVFYGDSITDQRRYTSFVETYVRTRFPDLDVTFVHSGWGGDRVTGGGGGPIDVRLWRDVLPYNPTVVTIMLGMNDGRYQAYDEGTFQTYADGYTHIIETLQRQLPAVRITAIQPSAYDDVTREPGFPGGYNGVLMRYGSYLGELARERGLLLADLNSPLVTTLRNANAIDAEGAARLIPDRVHPGVQVALVMAQALLEAWGAPSTVTDVTIDATRAAATTAVNTNVSAVTTNGGVAWVQHDQALPMAVNREDPLVDLVLRSSTFLQTLNRQPLRVTGLAPGRYLLRIDSDEVGRFSAADLATGVDLAGLDTPMIRQASEVHALTLQRTAVHNTRWRQVQVPLQTRQSPEVLEVLGALDTLDAALDREQRAVAQPRPHTFEVMPE